MRLAKLLDVDLVEIDAIGERAVSVDRLLHLAMLDRARVERQRLGFKRVFARCLKLLDIGRVLAFEHFVERFLLRQRQERNAPRHLAHGILDHIAGSAVFQRLADGLVQIGVIVHDAGGHLIAVLVHEVGNVLCGQRTAAAGRGVGIQRSHLLREHRCWALLGRNARDELRIARRHHLPGAMHAAKHLHVGVDVALGLGEDHVTLALILHLFRSMERQTCRTSLIEDQDIEVAIVEIGDRLAPAGDRLFRAGPHGEYLGAVRSIVDDHVAAGDLADLHTLAREPRLDPVDGRHGQLAEVRAGNLLLGLLVGAHAHRTKLLVGEAVTSARLLREGLLDDDDAAPVEVALQEFAEVERERVSRPQAARVGILVEEAFQRVRQRDHRLLAAFDGVERVVDGGIGLDRQQHLIDDVVHDRGEIGRGGASAARRAIAADRLGIRLQLFGNALGGFVYEILRERLDHLDRGGETLIGLLVHFDDRAVIDHTVKAALAARILPRLAKLRRHDLLHGHATTRDEVAQLANVIDR